MRIEEYSRELRGKGFLVVGSSLSWFDHDSSKCEPIAMDLQRFPDGEPLGIGFEEMAQLADSDLFHTEPAKDEKRNFCKNYAEIMQGSCRDWQLGAFKVSYGGISLYYGNRQTGETGHLWILDAQRLYLTFEAPRTRFGLVPVYKVWIDCGKDGCCDTLVEEDLGYLRRELTFNLKDPDRETNIFHDDNQVLTVTEYAGI